MSENVRFCPGADSQRLPLCPLPAVCSEVMTNVPSDTDVLRNNSAATVLVE